MKKILVVDDEVQILKALERMFLETNYEITTAESGTDALKLMESTEFDMIISDMRMPIMDGYELLTIVKEKYPKMIRIILSGYAEEKSMFRALLHNLAKMYIFKPWNNNDFLKNVEKLFDDENELNSIELMNLIKDMGCTSETPKNCEKMISLIEDENMDALITEIEQDAEISELLIQVAKSAVYGVMPNTIKQAAHYIGLHNLKCFMHWACLVCATKQTDITPNRAEILWEHAYLTNRILLFFYEAFLHKQPPESAMFAGLMHNIGLIILSKSLAQKGIIDRNNLSVNDYITMENGEYEINHEEIGAHFLDVWDIPLPVYEVALFHHRPLEPTVIFHELVSAVHIAQAYAWKTLGADDAISIKPEVFESLGITAEEFEKRLFRYLK